MAKGNKIVVLANPCGRHDEGTITGALKPGTFLQLDISETIDTNNKFTYEVFTADADGDKRPLIILEEDWGQGKLMTTAYTSADHCYVYYPLAGNEVNALLKDIAGTGDDHSFGDLLILDSGTGKAIATTTNESEPLILLEAVTDPTADQLVHCLVTGY